MSIIIKRSPSIDELKNPQQFIRSTNAHIDDIRNGLTYIAKLMQAAGNNHDHTKLDDPEGFFKALKSKNDNSDIFMNHYKLERHHLLDHIPDDVDLIDVMEFLVDGCMAGMARSQNYTLPKIDPQMLVKAFENTTKRILEVVKVDDDLMSETIE
jgi:hypothetical protein